MIATMPTALHSKHPPIEGVTQNEARSVLRSAVGRGNLGLEEVIRTLDCDAARGDAVLRAMAAAGYVEPAGARGQLFYWALTPTGNRLAMEKKRNRVGPEKVQATIAEVVARAKLINADGDRLQRITLKLFGSALEDHRADYGDVDVSIAFHRRNLSNQEKQRIETALCARQSEHDRQSVFSRLMGAERQDTREIRAALKKGLSHLSGLWRDRHEEGDRCPVVVGRMSNAAQTLPDDPALLKALIVALQAENAKISATLRAHDQLIRTLRLRIAKLKKQVFGQSSEKIEREIEQLELALEDLLIATAESETSVPDDSQGDDVLETSATDGAADRPFRRRPRVSDSTPRERQELDPGSCCPDCGSDLRLVGEDVSEMLDLIAARLKVVQIARLKKSCRRCERMVQVPAPSRPIPGSMAGANLLAHILVSKFDDHLPLYRQHEIFARLGADIPDSTLVDWCGRAMKVLQPLIERIEADVMASDLLHADDTPIRVLDRASRDKGLGKGVKKGRIWAYVRDQRPWAGSSPPRCGLCLRT